MGLGPIGMECLRAASAANWACVVGAIDIDSAKVGKDLQSLSGDPGHKGLQVVSSVSQLRAKPDLIFHTTVSRFKAAYAQLAPVVKQGINVVSSCEELVFPQLGAPALARNWISCASDRARESSAPA